MVGIRPAEVALFFRRLHVMLQAGISLPESLAYLEKGEGNPSFRQLIDGCLDTLYKGYPLSQEMRKHPRVFPTMVVEMVANGETTGGLVSTLGHLATLQERNLERRQRIRAALVYPLCLLVVMVLVVALFVVFVAPGDEGLLSVLGDDVPWPSKVLMAISDFISNPAAMLGGASVLLTLLLLFRRAYHDSLKFRLRVDSRCLGLPVVGKLLARLDAARTLDVLASSIKVGLPNWRRCRRHAAASSGKKTGPARPPPGLMVRRSLATPGSCTW